MCCDSDVSYGPDETGDERNSQGDDVKERYPSGRVVLHREGYDYRYDLHHEASSDSAFVDPVDHVDSSPRQFNLRSYSVVR